ncbi:MAG: hypothetical protein LBH76_03520 [Propionibacteriaceae bacterium]|nr:hypothetical protein [Propionibacteriaceae bacterium]
MITCAHCGHEFSSALAACPVCHIPVNGIPQWLLRGRGGAAASTPGRGGQPPVTAHEVADAAPPPETDAAPQPQVEVAASGGQPSSDGSKSNSATTPAPVGDEAAPSSPRTPWTEAATPRPSASLADTWQPLNRNSHADVAAAVENGFGQPGSTAAASIIPPEPAESANLPTAEAEISEPTGPIGGTTPATAAALLAEPIPPAARPVEPATQASPAKATETTGETTLRLSEILPDSELRGPALFGITDDSTPQLSSELLNSAARLQGSLDQPTVPPVGGALAWPPAIGAPLTASLGAGGGFPPSAADNGLPLEAGGGNLPLDTAGGSLPLEAGGGSLPPSIAGSSLPPSIAGSSPQPDIAGSSPQADAAGPPPAASDGPLPDAAGDDSPPDGPDDLFRSRRIPSAADIAAAASAAAGTQVVGPVSPTVSPSSAAASGPAAPSGPGRPLQDPPRPPEETDEDKPRRVSFVIGVVAIVVGMVVLLVLVLYYLYRTWAADPAPPPAPATSASASANPSASASPDAAETPSASPSPDGESPASETPPDNLAGALPDVVVNVCEPNQVGTLSANTSCDFALNVAKAIPIGSTGDFSVTGVYSPVTNREYTLQCQTRETYYECVNELQAILVIAFGREGR